MHLTQRDESNKWTRNSKLALQTTHLQALPFVLNALQMKSNLRAPAIRKSLCQWSANWTLIRKMIIAQCVHSFCLTIVQPFFLLYHPLTINILQPMYMHNINVPEIKLKLVSEKETHLSRYYWHKINWMTFVPNKSVQWNFAHTILSQQALSNTQYKIGNIIKSLKSVMGWIFYPSNRRTRVQKDCLCSNAFVFKIYIYAYTHTHSYVHLTCAHCPAFHF